MATNQNRQNISIQWVQTPRSKKTVYVLPRENLNEAEINSKSTSDKRKHRVAHIPKYPLTVIKRPIMPIVPIRVSLLKNLKELRLNKKKSNDDEKRPTKKRNVFAVNNSKSQK